jgi:hypothetical protein
MWGATNKKIGKTDDRQLMILVNSASTAPPIGLPPIDGRVLPCFQQIVSGASMPPCPIVAVF